MGYFIDRSSRICILIDGVLAILLIIIIFLYRLDLSGVRSGSQYNTYIRIEIKRCGPIYASPNGVLQSLQPISPENLKTSGLDGYPLDRLLSDSATSNVFLEEGLSKCFIVGDSMVREVGSWTFINTGNKVIGVSRGSERFYDFDPYCVTSSIPGATTSKIGLTLKFPIRATVPFIIIMAGTNDSHRYHFNAEKFQESYLVLLNKARTTCPNSKVICVSLIPRCDIADRFVKSSPDINSINSNILAINNVLKSLVANDRYGSLLYLDLYSKFMDALQFPYHYLVNRDRYFLRRKRYIWSAFYRQDGLHPFGVGVDLISKEIIRIVKMADK